MSSIQDTESPFELDAAPSGAGGGHLENVPGREARTLAAWKAAFKGKRKDWRYFEIVEDTICPEFTYRALVIKEDGGKILGIQPFFVLDQDLLTGLSPRWLSLAGRVRNLWPGFLKLRTLMVGCAAGEGHLDGESPDVQTRLAPILGRHIRQEARKHGASLIVLKEFPAEYRQALSPLALYGFTRIPSMPMTRLDLSRFASFDDYVNQGLDRRKRKDLLKKFAAAKRFGTMQMEVITDISAVIDEVFPLYEQVLAKSKLRFETLSKAYFEEIARRMPDKARFFVWRMNGSAIGFSFCLVEGATLYGEYLGLDYNIALDIHLYFIIMRDTISWAIANGFTSIVSTALGYAPKYQMGHVLEPLDLYVRHTSPVLNTVMKRVLPFMEPTRAEPLLKRFRNYDALWGS